MQRAMPESNCSTVSSGMAAVGLAVHAHHLVRMPLLRPAQEPLLHRRAAVRKRQHLAVVHLQLVEQFADDPAFVVRADDGGQDRLRAERGDHRRDAAGAAEAVLLLADPQDGDGGLGADPLDVAPKIAIQHDIAHQQNAWASNPAPRAKQENLTSVSVSEWREIDGTSFPRPVRFEGTSPGFVDES